MEFITEKVKGKELKPGDMFSNVGQLYWSKKNLNQHLSIGEKVYIRTENPLPKDQREEEIYRITIKK